MAQSKIHLNPEARIAEALEAIALETGRTRTVLEDIAGMLDSVIDTDDFNRSYLRTGKED